MKDKALEDTRIRSWIQGRKREKRIERQKTMNETENNKKEVYGKIIQWS